MGRSVLFSAPVLAVALLVVTTIAAAGTPPPVGPASPAPTPVAAAPCASAY